MFFARYYNRKKLIKSYRVISPTNNNFFVHLDSCLFVLSRFSSIDVGIFPAAAHARTPNYLVYIWLPYSYANSVHRDGFSIRYRSSIHMAVLFVPCTYTVGRTTYKSYMRLRSRKMMHTGFSGFRFHLV